MCAIGVSCAQPVQPRQSRFSATGCEPAGSTAAWVSQPGDSQTLQDVLAARERANAEGRPFNAAAYYDYSNKAAIYEQIRERRERRWDAIVESVREEDIPVPPPHWGIPYFPGRACDIQGIVPARPTDTVVEEERDAAWGMQQSIAPKTAAEVAEIRHNLMLGPRSWSNRAAAAVKSTPGPARSKHWPAARLNLLIFRVIASENRSACVDQSVCRVHPIILHEVISRR